MVVMEIRVLLVEDDPMVQEVNRQFIERIPGFEVIGVASSGEDGLRLVRELNPDLLLLDVYMPELNGIDMLKALREDELQVEVIAITAANDTETVRTMLHHGARDYLIKPFKFERFQQALLDFRNYHEKLGGTGSVSQYELDKIAVKEESTLNSIKPLPKGLNKQTLKQILSYIERHGKPLTAEETAEGVGIARVTARRYLDHMQKSGQVEIAIQYGAVGRPLNRYSLVKSPSL